MAWIKSSNSNSTKPSALDTTTSRKFVYIRKDFEEKPSYDQEGEQTGTHWEYLENKIPKEDWETYQQVMENTSSIATLEDAICDLTMGE